MRITSSQLKDIRESHRLTQSQLASKLNVTQTYIAHLESGRRKLSESLSQKLIDRLDITPDKLTRISEFYTSVNSADGKS